MSVEEDEEVSILSLALAVVLASPVAAPASENP
jgi:hypothetical protein